MLVQYTKTPPLRVARPVVGQLYVMEHPILGGHYRTRIAALNCDTVVACFVDYGDVVLVWIKKIFVPPDGLELLNFWPLVATLKGDIGCLKQKDDSALLRLKLMPFSGLRLDPLSVR